MIGFRSRGTICTCCIGQQPGNNSCNETSRGTLKFWSTIMCLGDGCCAINQKPLHVEEEVYKWAMENLLALLTSSHRGFLFVF